MHNKWINFLIDSYINCVSSLSKKKEINCVSYVAHASYEPDFKICMSTIIRQTNRMIFQQKHNTSRSIQHSNIIQAHVIILYLYNKYSYKLVIVSFVVICIIVYNREKMSGPLIQIIKYYIKINRKSVSKKKNITYKPYLIIK